MFAYLAVAGGFAVPPTLGSVSLHHRTGVGGLGRPYLRAGDRLPLAAGGARRAGARAPRRRAAHESGPIRVVLGPQDDLFHRCCASPPWSSSDYAISEQADRMGVRLIGPKLEHSAKGYNIVSDGIPTGAIQVPGNGMPLILLADRQTTGGYPKIATVISADLPRLAQSRPGTKLRFKTVERAEAVRIARAADQAQRELFTKIRPTGLAGLNSSELLALNLVDGVIDARG